MNEDAYSPAHELETGDPTPAQVCVDGKIEVSRGGYDELDRRVEAGYFGCGFVRTGRDVAIVEVDLVSKYAVVIGSSVGTDAGGPLVWLSADERTLKTRDSESPTIVAFPAFAGYEVYQAWVGRYTLHVVLLRRDASRTWAGERAVFGERESD